MAINLEKLYGFDKKAADKGVKMIIGPDAKEDYLMVRKSSNDAFRQELQEQLQANKITLAALKAEDDKSAYFAKDAEILSSVMARTLITGWGTGIQDKGKSIKFSEEKCVDLLIAYPDLRAEVQEFADNNANYPLTPDVADIKKS